MGYLPHTPGRPPPGRHPPGQTPPYPVHAGIRSTSGRYASYWNAFLLKQPPVILSQKENNRSGERTQTSSWRNHIEINLKYKAPSSLLHWKIKTYQKSDSFKRNGVTGMTSSRQLTQCRFLFLVSVLNIPRSQDRY